MSYTQEFKNQALEKLFNLPVGETQYSLAKSLGVPTSTLNGWKKSSIQGSMRSKKTSNKVISAELKLEAVTKLAQLSEEEFGLFLREKGLHSHEVMEWKEEALKFFSAPKLGRPKKDPALVDLEKEHKDLKKDLNRKDKALAEMSARVVLLKKSQKVFGLTDPGDEE